MYKIWIYFEKGQVIVQGFPQVLRTWEDSLLKFDEGGGLSQYMGEAWGA